MDGSLAVASPLLEVADDPADRVQVRLDDLLLGRPLTAPIFDNHGVLLLAAGNVITNEFKRLLRARGDQSIRIAKSAANQVRLEVAPPPVNFVQLDQEITARIDKLIDGGLLRINNAGPTVKERATARGCEPYGDDTQRKFQTQRAASMDAVNELMKEALRGRNVDSQHVQQMAAEYLIGLMDDTDCALSVTLQATQEPSLSDHCLKMATLGMALGIEMGLNEENCRRICMAGLLHDWGMALVDRELREAKRVLTEHEMYEVRKHPIYTAEMLDRMPGLQPVVSIVAYQVHEQPNGYGYPRGRGGDRIHQFARILAVADVFSALTSPRPHRPPLTPYHAMECIVKMARRREVDPVAVRALLHVMTLFPIGSYVMLNDQRLARVIRRNKDQYTTPVVQIVQDAVGLPIGPDEPDSIVDLSQSSLHIVQALPTPGSNEIELTEPILTVERPRG